MPKISVLTPTYNPDPNHLKEAIDRLLAQTEQDWTLFIHDDASKVDVSGMVKPYLTDPLITYPRSETNLGIGGNWNACVQKGVTADTVACLFQDDLWEPQYLERALNILKENPTVGFVSMDHDYMYEGEVPTVDAYKELTDFKRAELTEGVHIGKELLAWWIDHELHPNVIGEPPFVVFRRSLLEAVGPFTEDMPQNLDIEYWVRCLLQTDWYYSKDISGQFRVHPMGASAQNDAAGRGKTDRLRCFERLIKWLPAGKLKRATIRARNSAFTGMVKKYWERRRSNLPAMDGSGSNKQILKAFALRHPILVGTSLVKAVLVGK